MARRLALVIASYTYDDPGLRQLTAPAHDAEAFAAVLQDERIAGFEVTTLVNAPNHRVGEAIGDFYRDRRRDDITLLYFTGHGLKDDAGRLYLAMTNTRLDSLLFTALSAEQLDRAMEACASRQKILILDCCYSGAFPSGQLPKGDPTVHSLERFRGRGRTVLTASDSFQYSFEGSQVSGQPTQSVFTRHLVQGLRDGSADLDGDGDITVDELYGYVHDRVVDESPRQRPKKQDDVEGRIVIARNTRWVLPVYLDNAIHSPIANDRLGALDGLAHLHRIGNDMVRSIVRRELERLADDDSKLVSAAAEARLRSLDPHLLEPEDLPEAPSAPPRSEAVTTTSEVKAPPPTTPPIPPTAPPAPPPARAEHAWPTAERAGAASAPPTQASKPAHLVSALCRILPRLAGALALTAGALLVAGEILWATSGRFDPYGFGNGSFWKSPRALGSILAEYTAGMAVLALIAGLLTLLPRTRSQVGPGVLLGVGAASLWGLAYFTTDFDLSFGPHFGGRSWIEIIAYALLLIAALGASVRLWRDSTVRVAIAVPDNLARRAILLAALVGVAALLGQLVELTAAKQVDENLRAWVAPFLAISVLALIVPAVAAVMFPRNLAVAILAGWIGGGAAIFASSLALVTGAQPSGREEIVGFGFALLILLFGALRLRAEKSIEATRTAEATGPATSESAGTRRLVLIALTLVGLTVGVAAAVVVRNSPVPAMLTDVAVSPDGSRVYAVGNTSSGTKLWTVDAAAKRVVGDPISLGNSRQDFYQVAVSPDGHRAYVTRRDSNTVRVIDTDQNTTTGTPITVGEEPADIAVTPDGRRAYVTNSSSNSVSVIDTVTNRTIGRPIPVGSTPRGIAVSPDGDRVYVASSGSNEVFVIDTATAESIGEPIPVADEPGGLAISQDGRQLYVTNGGFWSSVDEAVVVIDTETGKHVGRPIDYSTSAASKRLWVTGWPGVAANPDDHDVYVTSGWSNAVISVDTAEGQARQQAIQVGEHALGIAASPDGRYLYVATADGVSIIDSSSFTSELVPILDPARRHSLF